MTLGFGETQLRVLARMPVLPQLREQDDQDVHAPHAGGRVTLTLARQRTQSNTKEGSVIITEVSWLSS